VHSKSLSLDDLHAASDEDAMRTLVSFDGVGPKTASCVLLFCLGRESFAVDTCARARLRCDPRLTLG
jgi:3-methyladenine DNA glycosylase/8-oxoguanine DNA glycosylase